MVGYPNFLNTKEDYIYVHDNFQKEQWLPDFQALLDTMKDWFFDNVLADGEIGITDETHKVVIEEVELGDDRVQRNVQYILKENPDCKLRRLGFTIPEVKKLMAGE